MKILLAGECYSENLGDGVICRTVQHAIQDVLPEAEIVCLDLSGKTGYGPEPQQKNGCLYRARRAVQETAIRLRNPLLYQVCQQDTDRHRRFCKQLDKCMKQRFDLVVFAGGALFMDYFAGVISLTVEAAAERHIPVIFHACGMGDCNAHSVALFSRSFRNPWVKSISLRDSYERFTRIFPGVAAEETYDTALACSCCFAPSQSADARYGVGLISMARYEQAQKNLLRSFLSAGVSWRAFTNGASYDQRFAEMLLRDVGIAPQEIALYLVPRTETPEQLVRTITSFSSIVSFRMHSQIVAASYGIPSFGLVWDDKIREQYRKLGYAENCCLPEEWRIGYLEHLQRDPKEWRKKALQAGEASIENLKQQLRKGGVL